MSVKEASTKKDNITYLLQGLLAGTAGVSAFQVAKHLHALYAKTQAKDEGTLSSYSEDDNAGKLEEILLKKDANALSGATDILGAVTGDLTDTTLNVVDSVTKPAQDNITRNALLALALVGSGYGITQAWDLINVRKARNEADQTKQYYYSRLMEAADKGDHKVKVKRTPLMRKEASGASGASGRDLLAFLALAGIPLGTAFVVRQYLDETMPGTAQPTATRPKDIKGRVGRVRLTNQPLTSEDDESKEVDGIAKLAATAPAVDRAVELGHVIRTLNGSKKVASETIVPDLIKLVECGYGRELKKQAAERTVFELIDWVVDSSAVIKSASSTPVSEHLAIDLLSSDFDISTAIKPIIYSAFADHFPSSVKMASSISESDAKASKLLIKLAKLKQEEELFGETELTKVASADQSLDSYSEKLHTYFAQSNKT